MLDYRRVSRDPAASLYLKALLASDSELVFRNIRGLPRWPKLYDRAKEYIQMAFSQLKANKAAGDWIHAETEIEDELQIASELMKWAYAEMYVDFDYYQDYLHGRVTLEECARLAQCRMYGHEWVDATEGTPTDYTEKQLCKVCMKERE